MLKNLNQLLSGYEWWQIVIELAVIWLIVYGVYRFLHGTRGAGVIKGFAVVLVIATAAFVLLGQASDAFARLTLLYDRFVGLVAVLLIVVFQPELRQAMGRLGHAWSFRTKRGSVNQVVHAVSEAVTFLSKSQFGALIAIERSARLGGLTDLGVGLDSIVNERLLESIFWPNSPLHDLGVVIRGDRIVAASVQFPLAEEGVLPVEFGSRHRAAVGLSLESDCLVVIVSEETGGISIAEYGRLDTDIPRDRFEEELSKRMRAPSLSESPARDAAEDEAEIADESEEAEKPEKATTPTPDDAEAAPSGEPATGHAA